MGSMDNAAARTAEGAMMRIKRIQRHAVALVLAMALTMAFLLGGSSRNAVAAQATPPAGASTPSTATATARGAAWLIGQQGDDGGFIGFSGESDPGLTADAVAGLKAAEFRGEDVAASLDAARVYLTTAGGGYAAVGPGASAKLVLAAVALGAEPSDFGVASGDVVARTGTPSPSSGLYGAGVFDHALVLMALAATHAPVPPAAVEALRGAQATDGSWAFDGSTGEGAGDTNTTAMAIQALIATANGGDATVDAALAYLKGTQTPTGGFPYQPGGAADGNSTALVVQAIVAAGQDPAGGEWNGAAGALAAFQNPSGAFRYTDEEPGDNLFATVQALPAIAGLPLPVAVACQVSDATTAVGTPVNVLPAPGRAEAPCVELDAAA